MNRGKDNARPGWAGHLDDLFARLRVGVRRSQRDVAARAGISETYLSEVFKRRKTPSADVAERIAAALGAGAADRRAARYYADNARSEPRPTGRTEPTVFRVEAFPLATPGAPRAGTFALSHLLAARNRIVPFTGREAELAALAEWLADPSPGVHVKLVHGPGGQGKSRLAAEFAMNAADDGWTVGQARHHTDLAPEGPALRKAGRKLLVVDYAERWPLADLLALVDGLRQDGNTHYVLLLARPAGGWWQSLCYTLAERDLVADQLVLPPLAATTADRQVVFRAARDRFAGLLGLPDPDAVSVPARLGEAPFGLALTLLMAALTAVDARVRGVEPPQDPAELSAYLLARERHYWRSLYELPAGQAISTTPEVMAQTVFTATVARAMSYWPAVAVLERVGIASSRESAGQVLRDHARCYPPTDSATMLEPLYPDRLAEDFLALQTPGHGLDGHVPDPWASGVALILLAPTDDGPPDYARAGLAMLVEAAQRWPHLAEAQISPLLRAHPELALAAGGVALTALAHNPAIGTDVLAGIEPLLPEHRHVELDAGACALVERLAAARLIETSDLVERANLRQNLGWRLVLASRYQEALAEFEQALDAYRVAARGDRESALVPLAGTVEYIGTCLGELGRFAEASPFVVEAVELRRELVRADPGQHRGGLARTLMNLGRSLAGEQRWAEATEAAEEAVELLRALAGEHPEEYEHVLALALNNLFSDLSSLARKEEANAVLGDAVDLYRRLAAADPARHEPEFGQALVNLSRSEVPARTALAAAMEAVEIYRRLAPGPFDPMLAAALATCVKLHSALGEKTEAVAVAEESAEVFRRLTPVDRMAHAREFGRMLILFGAQLGELGEYERQAEVLTEAVSCLRAGRQSTENEVLLASALRGLGMALAALGRRAEAVAACQESVALHQGLAAEDPVEYEAPLANVLADLGLRFADVHRWEEALQANREAAYLFERLAQADPDKYAGDVARVLTNTSMTLSGLERPDDALAAGQRARVAYERLAAVDPDYEPMYATALHNVGAMLDGLDRTREALVPTERAVRIRRRLAEQDPVRYGPKLAATLNNAATMLSTLGRPDDALASNTESVVLYRKLARLRPALFEVELARTLYVAAKIRVEHGQRLDEALEAAEESLRVLGGLTAAVPRLVDSIRIKALATKAQALLGLNRVDEAVGIIDTLRKGGFAP
ncbi:tetratricopeptide repeat protein [Amycolatopsis sp. NPDC049868]|uniref:tetratricopeptide repeat protein n=1 Tax=Amycolatopsis sp. NPDC049868 TaxID=3363934 RepID=UPI0037B6B257